jgi:hypothetical protein
MRVKAVLGEYVTGRRRGEAEQGVCQIRELVLK